MTFLKAKTQKLFVPSSIINSPLNPNNDMFILMRPTELLERGMVEKDILDENVIAKRFTVRVF
jgi:hypothetical protein